MSNVIKSENVASEPIYIIRISNGEYGGIDLTIRGTMEDGMYLYHSLRNKQIPTSKKLDISFTEV